MKLQKITDFYVSLDTVNIYELPIIRVRNISMPEKFAILSIVYMISTIIRQKLKTKGSISRDRHHSRPRRNHV